MTDIHAMITDLHNKFIQNPTKPKSTRRMSLREYFINCYVKEDIYTELTPFQLTHGDINDVKKLAAEITFKLLRSEDKQNIQTQYSKMTDEQLDHLKSM